MSIDLDIVISKIKDTLLRYMFIEFRTFNIVTVPHPIELTFSFC
jgi:hypothetical protein